MNITIRIKKFKLNSLIFSISLFIINIIFRLSLIDQPVTVDELNMISSGYRIIRTILKIPIKGIISPCLIPSTLTALNMFILKGKSILEPNIYIDLISARLPQIIFGASTPIVLFYLSKKFYSENLSIISALLLSFEPIYIGINSTAIKDSSVTFFFLLSTFIFIKGVMERRKYIFISTIFIGFSILSKLTGFLLMFTLYIPYLYLALSKHIQINKRFIFMLIIPLSFLLFWPYLWDFNNWTFFFNWIINLIKGFNPKHRIYFLGKYTFPPYYYYFLLMTIHLSPQFILGLIIGILIFLKRDIITSKKSFNVPSIFIISSILISILFFSIIEFKAFRNLTIILPFLSIISAFGLEYIFKKIRFYLHTRKIINKKINIILISSLLIISTIQIYYQYPFLSEWEYINPFIGGELAAKITRVGRGREGGIIGKWIHEKYPESRVAVLGYTVIVNRYHSTSYDIIKRNIILDIDKILLDSDFILFELHMIQSHCQKGQGGYKLWTFFSNKKPIYEIKKNGISYAYLFLIKDFIEDDMN